MEITEKDLIGKLTGVPLEIAKLMVEEQLLQGNPANIKAFQEYFAGLFLPKKEDGGFNAVESRQGNNMWADAMTSKNFTQLLKWIEENKNIQEIKFPCLMWVGHTTEEVVKKVRKRVVFLKKNNKFIAWVGAESLEHSEHETETRSWKYAKLVTETIVTKQQIADKFGCHVAELKIID